MMITHAENPIIYEQLKVPRVSLYRPLTKDVDVTGQVQWFRSSRGVYELFPSRELIHEIAIQLFGDGQIARGHCRLINIDRLTQDNDILNRLQDRMLIGIAEQLFASVETPLVNSRESQFKIHRYLTQDGSIPRGVAAHKEDGLRWSFKDVHFDPNAIIFAHRYYPIVNIDGGDLLIVEINRYCRDANKPLAECLEPGQGNRFQVKSGILEELKEGGYVSSMPISTTTPTMCFVNNLSRIGVAHGASPVRIKDPSLPYRRHFYRTSISLRKSISKV